VHRCKIYIIALSSAALVSMLQTASADIKHNPIGTVAPDTADNGPAETGAHDKAPQQLFVSNGNNKSPGVLDLGDPKQRSDTKTATNAPGIPFIMGSTVDQPDMLVFTSDGRKVLVPNDGEPDDHNGPVSSIELPNGGENASDFSSFNPAKDELQRDQFGIFDRSDQK